MMEVQYRKAHPADLPECVDLFLESLSDMRARHNIEPSASPSHSTAMKFYQHILSTGFFHVAEIEGRIAAFACAIFRDQLWFLSGYWARPKLQRQKIGMSALRGVWEEGRAAGANNFFVDASVDLPAMASYVKIGMLPGTQILYFEGAPQPFDRTSGYNAMPLDKSFAMELDQSTLGTRREMDHDFFAKMGWQGRQVTCNGDGIGYYYLDEGNIGPAAWTEDRHGVAILTLACREASTSNPKISLQIPGMNHVAIRFAFDANLRLTGFSHLLMSNPFGRLEHYLPSGPDLF